MKKNEQIKIAIFSYIIGIFGATLLSFIKFKNPLLNSVIGSIKISTVLTIWWSFYFSVGWKCLGKTFFFRRINLNGTWFGTYESVNLVTDDHYNGEIALRIKQDFLNISVLSMTEKYKNYSYSEEIQYDEKTGTYGLVYVYSQKENNILDSNQRNGSCEIRVSQYQDRLLLEGEFWTIHGSKGKLLAERIHTKPIDTFKESKELAVGFKGGK